MAILKDNAQVLRVYEQGNTSLIVVLLGRQLGPFRVLVKGGRRWHKKGFEGGFDLLTRGQILVYPRGGESLWIFKEWEERARPALGASLLLLRAASFLCELTEALTRPRAGAGTHPQAGDESNRKLYDVLSAAADALAGGASPGPLLMTFTLRALESEGLLPAFGRCGTCERTFVKDACPVYLSGRGLYCRECLARIGAPSPQAGRRVVVLRGADSGPAAPPVGFWLTPAAHGALLRLQKSARPFGLDAAAGRQLGQALVLLVHAALERDLRTLPAAAVMVRKV